MAWEGVRSLNTPGGYLHLLLVEVLDDAKGTQFVD